MARTRSVYPSLKSRGQQPTKDREKENYKHLSLFFRGNKHYQMKGEVSSLKCSLFRVFVLFARALFFAAVIPHPPFHNFHASWSGDRVILCSSKMSCLGFWSFEIVKKSVGYRIKRNNTRPTGIESSNLKNFKLFRSTEFEDLKLRNVWSG